ncbi:MAG TPA: hypothetical protein VFH66_11280 [Mycobacteriales bacterium]|nr:hypothetical protein [Mycobacteriales bacterium]
MTPHEGAPARTRSAPSAQCRLCSAVVSIDAPTTDQLRVGLRRFMAAHRHDGLADIVIDISDESREPGEVDDDVDVAVASGAGVSGG